MVWIYFAAKLQVLGFVIGVFSSHLPGINIANSEYGGTCTQTIPEEASAESCDRLINGVEAGAEGTYAWTLTDSTKSIGGTVQLTFDKIYELYHVNISHLYHDNERNIKSLQLRCGNSWTQQITLTRGSDKGYGFYQDFELSPTPTCSSMEFRILSVFSKSQEHGGLFEIKVLGAEPHDNPTASTETATDPDNPAATPGDLTSSTENQLDTRSDLQTTSIIPGDPGENTPGNPGEDRERVERPDDNLVPIVAGVVGGFVVILICIILVAVFCKRRKKKVPQEDEAGLNSYHSVDSNLGNIEMQRVRTIRSTPYANVRPETKFEPALRPKEPEVTNTTGSEEHTHMIPVAAFVDEMNVMKSTKDSFQKEFASIPAGPILSITLSKAEELNHKNRFRNIRPYDDNRVTLSQLGSDEHSVYINASYINSHDTSKHYIAAQGPNKFTIEDFWKMIWEQEVYCIVMITNLMEGQKEKCSQYWPDGKAVAAQFGTVEVTTELCTVLTNYTTRTFKLTVGDTNRTVRQYHYTSWPDEKVPIVTTPLIQFIKEIRTQFKDTKPILTHCSAGVGRTGVFIAINNLIDMAAKSGHIDVLNTVYQLRRQRINMVQTRSQYELIYNAVLQYLLCDDVVIPVADANARVHSLYHDLNEDDETGAKVQWKVLDVFKPKLYDASCVSAKENSYIKETSNISKNRSQSILPSDETRPRLKYRKSQPSDYINAVFVQNFAKEKSFIVTQHPLEHTEVDFWRTVVDHKCSVIVMLNSLDDETKVYWPTGAGNTVLQHGPVTVTCKRCSQIEGITQTDLEVLDNDTQVSSDVTHFQAPSIGLLEKVYDMATGVQMKHADSTITVHDKFGADESGLYCIAHAIFDKIKTDHEIDVFNAVMLARLARPSFISDEKSYRNLHEHALSFIRNFDDYSNFKF